MWKITSAKEESVAVLQIFNEFLIAMFNNTGTQRHQQLVNLQRNHLVLIQKEDPSPYMLVPYSSFPPAYMVA